MADSELQEENAFSSKGETFGLACKRPEDASSSDMLGEWNSEGADLIKEEQTALVEHTITIAEETVESIPVAENNKELLESSDARPESDEEGEGKADTLQLHSVTSQESCENTDNRVHQEKRELQDGNDAYLEKDQVSDPEESKQLVNINELINASESSKQLPVVSDKGKNEIEVSSGSKELSESECNKTTNAVIDNEKFGSVSEGGTKAIKLLPVVSDRGENEIEVSSVSKELPENECFKTTINNENFGTASEDLPHSDCETVVSNKTDNETIIKEDFSSVSRKLSKDEFETVVFKKDKSEQGYNSTTGKELSPNELEPAVETGSQKQEKNVLQVEQSVLSKTGQGTEELCVSAGQINSGISELVALPAVQEPKPTKTDTQCYQISTTGTDSVQTDLHQTSIRNAVLLETAPNVKNEAKEVKEKASEAQSTSTKQENASAEVKTTPTTVAVSKKGFAQLEQMSHEDLLKRCKQQLLLLQKTKMKNDDLSRNILDLQNENKTLKEASAKTSLSGEVIRRLQSENDRLLDDKESQAEVVVQLQKDMTKLVADLTACKEDIEESKGKCNQLKELLTAAELDKKRQDAHILELQSKIIVKRSERDSDLKKMEAVSSEAKQWEAKCLSLEAEVKNKCQEIVDLRASVDNYKQELEQGKVLSLEIGDYERSLSDLHVQLDQKSHTAEKLNVQLVKKQEEHDALQLQIEHLEHQCLSEESRSAHLKESLENARQQLAAKCEELSNLAASLDEMKCNTENILADKEELQYQLSVSSGRMAVLEGELKRTRDQSEKLDCSLKSHILSVMEELTETRQQLETSRKEFHDYKVRVHSVLKQQKTSAAGQPVTNLSVLDESQKEQMEWTLELCKGKITQMTDQIGALTLERDGLQKEQEWLVSKHNLQIQQLQEKEANLVQRIEELKQQFDLSHNLWETEKKQQLQQQQSLTHEYEHRLYLLKSEHEKHVASLISQLEQAQRNIPVFSPPVVDQVSQRQISIFDFLPATQLSPSVDESFDICSQERQEGEGSECTDTLPAPAAFQTLVTTPATGLMPLERLLQQESNPNLCNQDPEMVAISMNSLQKKLDHISELLNESEANNLRLSEQTRVLKEEIRRLERNTERQEHSENLEYLKNIVFKFNTLPAGSERERLVPVISTLLKLSPEEQAQLMDSANQGTSSGASASGGWGNYLHRWSGLA